MRPLDLRGDLMATPKVLTNWGFLAAIGLTAGAAALFVIAYSDAMAAIPVGTATPEQLEQVVGSSTIPYFLGTMAPEPPPAIGAFLIGFTAKRASWLGGLIYGIFVTIVAIVVLQTQAGRLLTGDGPRRRSSWGTRHGRRSAPRCSHRLPRGIAGSWTSRTRTARPSSRLARRSRSPLADRAVHGTG